MNGTYTLALYTAQDDFETVTLVLKEEGGALRGFLPEILYRPLLLENGLKTGDAFSFHNPSFITVSGDISMDIVGKIDGKNISGQVITPLGTVPFWGKQTSDATPGLE